MRLYEIDRALEELIERLVDPEAGELAESDEFDKLQMERDKYIENCIRWYKNEHAEQAALSAEAKKLEERANAAGKRANRAKEILREAANGVNYSCVSGTVAFKKNPSKIVVQEGVQLEDKWLRTKTTTEVDKAALQDAIKSGMEIPGVQLISTTRIEIK